MFAKVTRRVLRLDFTLRIIRMNKKKRDMLIF